LRTARSAVATPPDLAALLAVLAIPEGARPGRVLDPACGDGALLEAAAERLAVALGSRAEAERRLVGVDVDEAALAKAARRVPAATLRCADALGGALDAERFDAILCNPPYARAARRRRREGFELAHGAADLYVHFAERCAGWLARGGRAVLLTSNKWLVADYGAPMRARLAELGLVRVIDLGPVAAFPDALVEAAIAVIAPGTRAVPLYARLGRDDRTLAFAASRAPEGDHDGFSVRRIEAGRFVTAPRVALSMVQALRSAPGVRPLGEVATIRTGAAGFDYHAFAASARDGSPRRGEARLLPPGLLRPFRDAWGTRSVRLWGRRWERPVLRLAGSPLSAEGRAAVAAEKLVVRGVARRLTASHDPGGAAPLVMAHAVLGEDPFFLLGLLNSTAWDLIHRVELAAARIPRGSFRYPVAFLRTLPVPEGDRGAVRREARLLARGRGSREALDRAVARLFALEPHAIARARASLAP
jgi:SAM-dependent methyltransferase